AREELTQRNGVPPSAADLASHLGVSTDEVLDAIEAAQVYRSTSLFTPVGDDGVTLMDVVGAPDPDLDAVDDRVSLPPVIAKLPEREQRILAMRFYGNMTQSQIAEATGVSQMHVSRLLKGALGRLRRELAGCECGRPWRPAPWLTRWLTRELRGTRATRWMSAARCGGRARPRSHRPSRRCGPRVAAPGPPAPPPVPTPGAPPGPGRPCPPATPSGSPTARSCCAPPVPRRSAAPAPRPAVAPLGSPPAPADPRRRAPARATPVPATRRAGRGCGTGPPGPSARPTADRACCCLAPYFAGTRTGIRLTGPLATIWRQTGTSEH